jgi:hypothetical protein
MNNAVIDEACEFMKKHNSKALDWGEDNLRRYIEFYFKNQSIAFGIVREQGKMIALGMARPLDLLNLMTHSKNYAHYDKNGDVIYINVVCASDKRAVPRLWDIMIEQLGRRPFVAGRRHDKVRLWDFKKYQDIVYHLEA